MSYEKAQRHDPLRPYTPSYDSFTPPFTNSTGGTNTPTSSSDSEGPGGTSEGERERRRERGRRGPNEKHDAIYMGGGTGMSGSKEPKEVVRKRVTIMTICGLVIAAIITIAVLGIKKVL
ncbi:hypothetical protein JCM16303_005240 [Sporobolomyces ruberrimus]